MDHSDSLIIWSLMSNTSMAISRCSFCGESLLVLDKRPDIMVLAPQMVCGCCGIETQWHGCLHNEDARRFIQQEADRLGKEDLSSIALNTHNLRQLLQIAEAKGWQNLSQKP